MSKIEFLVNQILEFENTKLVFLNHLLKIFSYFNVLNIFCLLF